ncbi:MAG: acetyl-CoA carboxylase biotin carboxyl carrier protein subunit [Aquaticitalea sp.]
MPKSYIVKVNNSFEFDINLEQLSKLDTVELSNSKQHILKNHHPYHAEITSKQFQEKKYTIKINNNSYIVDIHNDLDELIKSLGFEVGASKKVNDIKAPMPGLILEMSITIGQEVKENDTILILEAMKMENVLTSPRDGVIKSIAANKGDAVEKNQLLVEFE